MRIRKKMWTTKIHTAAINKAWENMLGWGVTVNKDMDKKDVIDVITDLLGPEIEWDTKTLLFDPQWTTPGKLNTKSTPRIKMNIDTINYGTALNEFGYDTFVKERYKFEKFTHYFEDGLASLFFYKKILIAVQCVKDEGKLRKIDHPTMPIPVVAIIKRYVDTSTSETEKQYIQNSITYYETYFKPEANY